MIDLPSIFFASRLTPTSLNAKQKFLNLCLLTKGRIIKSRKHFPEWRNRK